MNVDRLGLVFGVAILAQSALAGADSLVSSQDRLQCDDAEVLAETTCLTIPDIETQCVKQDIRLVNAGKGISKSLPHEGRLVAKFFVKATPVLDAFVTSWACLKSTSGAAYVLLLYTCSWGDEKSGCTGDNREWERIFDLAGRHVTAGFGRQDQRYDQLYRRLGLSEIVKQGIDLQTVRR